MAWPHRVYNIDERKTNTKATVNITWDQVTNAAYRVSFTNIGRHWIKCELLINLIKTTIPTSQREYDPSIKTWFIGEKYIKNVKLFAENIPEFDVHFVER